MTAGRSADARRSGRSTQRSRRSRRPRRSHTRARSRSTGRPRAATRARACTRRRRRGSRTARAEVPRRVNSRDDEDVPGPADENRTRCSCIRSARPRPRDGGQIVRRLGVEPSKRRIRSPRRDPPQRRVEHEDGVAPSSGRVAIGRPRSRTRAWFGTRDSNPQPCDSKSPAQPIVLVPNGGRLASSRLLVEWLPVAQKSPGRELNPSRIHTRDARIRCTRAKWRQRVTLPANSHRLQGGKAVFGMSPADRATM